MDSGPWFVHWAQLRMRLGKEAVGACDWKAWSLFLLSPTAEWICELSKGVSHRLAGWGSEPCLHELRLGRES